MGTKWHKLRKLKSGRLPKRIVCFDCETEPIPTHNDYGDIQHRIKLCCAKFLLVVKGKVFAKEERTFTTGEQFFAWLESKLSKRDTTYVFAHNLGFDWTVAGGWDQLEKGWAKTVSYVCDDPPTILLLEHERGWIKCVDSLNYWRAPLSALAESLGLRKMDWNLCKDNPIALEQYCKNDVNILAAAVERLVHCLFRKNWGPFQATGPALSFAVYRYKFMQKEILIHSDPDATYCERESYFGGRADCHFIGTTSEKVYVVDVNSLYPWAMSRYKMPCKLVEHGECDIATLRLRLSTGLLACAHVKIESDTTDYPIRVEGKPQFVRGKFHTFLCTPELKYALDRGHIKACKWASWYQAEDLFSDFVDYFYRLKTEARNNGDYADECMAKLVLNSLFGKFGQRSARWKIDKTIRACKPFGDFLLFGVKDKTPRYCRAIAGLVSVRQERGEWIHSFPAISAHITSFGRVLMLSAVEKAGVENVYYEDTDALHVNQEGYDRLLKLGRINQDKLGAFKLVNHASGATYNGIRNYHIGERKVVAAVSSKAVQINDTTYLQDSFLGIQHTINNGNLDSIIVRPTYKRVVPHRYHGRVGFDGRVRPLVVGQGVT